MGWMADKQAETATRLRAVIDPQVPAGETLRGAVYATKPSTFSAKLYAVGVTDQHLLVQEIDRKWKPVGAAPVIARTASMERPSTSRVWSTPSSVKSSWNQPWQASSWPPATIASVSSVTVAP